MPTPTLPAQALLTDPGWLFWAPLASTLPTNTVTAGVFTDAWPVAWIPLGLTESGTDIDLSTSTSPIYSAEYVEPLAYRTTAREGTVTFMLKNFTAANLSKALNGTVNTVTGTTGTTMTQIDPLPVGSEVRAMFGYESLDGTYRWVGYQGFNDAGAKLSFNKAPTNTNIPFSVKLEKPASSQPWRAWTAGVGRA